MLSQPYKTLTRRTLILLTGSQASRYTDWLEANPDGGQEPTQTGVSLAFGKDQTLFDFYEREPERSKQFGLAMSSLGRPDGPFDSAFVVRGFDWPSLGNATLVDVSFRILRSAVGIQR